MTAHEKIDLFKTFLGKCEGHSWEEKRLDLRTTAEVSRDELVQLEDAGFVVDFESAADARLYAQRRLVSLASGSGVCLTVPQIASDLAVAPSFQAFLNLSGVTTDEPNAYVIWDGTTFCQFIRGSEVPPESPEKLVWYHQAIALWQLLKGCADHREESGTLLFLGARRVALDPGFGEDDFVANKISEILYFHSDQDRVDMRREILRSVLTDYLRDQVPEKAFRYLLKTTDLFSRRLKEGLAIYLSEHSPEKLQNEAEGCALGFSEKADKIVTGLEAKSLTIPAAVLLAFKEVSAGAGFTLLNSVILGSTILYGVTMTWSHVTQKSLIEQLQKSVGHYITDIKEKGLGDSNRVLSDIFPRLNKRIGNAANASLAMCIFSWVPLAAVFGDMMWGSPDKNKKAGQIQDEQPSGRTPFKPKNRHHRANI